MLVLKLMGLAGARAPAPAATPMTSSGSRVRPRVWADCTAAGKKIPPSPKPAPASPGAGGRGLTIAGAVVAGVFGFGGLSELLDALSYGWFWTSLSDIFIPLASPGGPYYALHGRAKGKKARRFANIWPSSAGGNPSRCLHGQAMGLSVRKVCDDLQDAGRGRHPQRLPGRGGGRLVLNDEGLREEPPAPAPEKQAEKPPPAWSGRTPC
jgi:hypothetical protein